MDNYILGVKFLLGKQTDEARVKYTKALISFQRHKSTIEILPIPNTGKLDICYIFEGGYYTFVEVHTRVTSKR